MSPKPFRLMALFQAALVMAVFAQPASANCFDPFKRQVVLPFEFTTSKQSQVAPGEVKVEPTSYRDSFTLTATVSSSTAREVSGTKESQRSEILETYDSGAAPTMGTWLCYGWTMSLAPDLTLPASGSPRAKLTLAQFHQTSTQNGKEPAVLFIDLDPDGNLVALFNDPVGRRSTVLVPGGSSKKDTLGKDWEISLAAKWSTGSDGRVIIMLREKNKGVPVEVMSDTGQNATAGYVYQKLGVYRHNIERDPALARSTISVPYSDISRNGVKAAFRGLSGGLSPVTAGTTGTTTTGTLGATSPSSSTMTVSGDSSGGSSKPKTRVLGKPPAAKIMKVQMGRGGSGSNGRGMTFDTN